MEAAATPRLLLFLAGDSDMNDALIEHLCNLLEELDLDSEVLRVIDVFETPELRDKYDIFVTPTLLHANAGGNAQMVGELSRLRDLQALFDDPQATESDR